MGTEADAQSGLPERLHGKVWAGPVHGHHRPISPAQANHDEVYNGWKGWMETIERYIPAFITSEGVPDRPGAHLHRPHHHTPHEEAYGFHPLSTGRQPTVIKGDMVDDRTETSPHRVARPSLESILRQAGLIQTIEHGKDGMELKTIRPDHHRSHHRPHGHHRMMNDERPLARCFLGRQVTILFIE